VIREAMRSKGLVALGRVVLSKRERVIALEPYDKGLLGTTLYYPYEVRHATDYFDEIPDLTPAPELLRLAAHILDGKAAAFEPASFRDRYEEALLAHLKAKQAGLAPQPQQNFAVPRRAINLMEALRRSIAEEKRKPAASRKASAAPARKRA
jgi:DNA end-binding protein Ku